ncbi:MAG: hypothetical protein IJI46_10395 [Erysipelotrichaceae bacterium]|nr:hypothetical protein [Erysipelotrichaceae bacterium]
MKIYCEKCHEDITAQVNQAIENYSVGKIGCHKCQHQQKRYISEADILLFFGCSEAAYALLSYFSFFLIKYLGIGFLSISVLIALLVLAFIGSKALSSAIYEKAYLKSDIKYKVFEEDKKAIQRNISWQFMLFFAITISFLTMDDGKIFFAAAMPLAVLFTFIKLYLQLKYEKSAQKKTSD